MEHIQLMLIYWRATVPLTEEYNIYGKTSQALDAWYFWSHTYFQPYNLQCRSLSSPAWIRKYRFIISKVNSNLTYTCRFIIIKANSDLNYISSQMGSLLGQWKQDYVLAISPTRIQFPHGSPCLHKGAQVRRSWFTHHNYDRRWMLVSQC